MCTIVPTGKRRINPSPPGSWHFIGDGEIERAPAQHEPGLGYAAATTPFSSEGGSMVNRLFAPN
jgi:hypothetical protein